jgi:TldD protein
MRDTAEAILGLVPAEAEYADVRVVHRTHELVLAEHEGPGDVVFDDSLGVGVRVLINGQWGFAATSKLDAKGLSAVVGQAVAQAKATTGVERVRLGDPVTTRARWTSPMEVDPFTVPLSVKLDLLVAAVKEAETAGPKVQRAEASMDFYRDDKVFANTEGALIEQTITESGGGLLVMAADDHDIQRRSHPHGVPRTIRGNRGQFSTAGYEAIAGLRLVEEAARVGDEAVALLTAPECPSETTTLVVSGAAVAHLLHEVSLAGRTYATPERRGGFRYGAPIVSVFADATLPGGLGSYGYDDEGVPAQRTQLVKDGIFLGYMSGRESAAALGGQSSGAARADGWQRTPLVRMTNLCLEPGDSSLEEMIADTEHGVFFDMNKGFSIDAQRMSFRFGTEVGYEIRGGKLGRLLKNSSYSGVTPRFWAGCDALGGPDEWEIHGIPSCGKGEPLQVMHIGHGTVPARFRDVRIGTK